MNLILVVRFSAPLNPLHGHDDADHQSAPDDAPHADSRRHLEKKENERAARDLDRALDHESNKSAQGTDAPLWISIAHLIPFGASAP
jgi:hypothetical protein